MFRALAAVAVVIALAGCAADPLPDAASVSSPYAFGGFPDPELGAVTTASWMFAEPTRSRTDPADAARAVAGVDYLAGALYANPRWVGLNPLIKQQMLGARAEVRQALGVAPGARSQDIVDALLNASDAMAARDDGAALKFLQAPMFTLGAQQTFALLHDLPHMQVANVATIRLNNALFGENSRNCIDCG